MPNSTCLSHVIKFFFTFLFISFHFIINAQSSSTICSGSSASLNGSGSAPITWYDAASGGTLLYTGTPFSTPVLTSNISYWYSANGGPRRKINVNVINPIASISSPVTISEGNSALLNATVAFGNGPVRWYSVPTGGVSLGSTMSGQNFQVTPSQTTTYYAEATTTLRNVVFNYTAAAQQWTVPPGITSIKIDMSAARGGNGEFSTPSIPGGNGGRVLTNMNVIPGQAIYLYVGGQGNARCNCGGAPPQPGWNGGGGTTANNGVVPGGTGGGASDIRIDGTGLNNRIVVAGGGGGGGTWSYGSTIYGFGGSGGGLTGIAGANITNRATPAYGGQGGTQSAGGIAGNNCDAQATAGVLGIGGMASGCYGNYGGSGGGGYYGGGGGSFNTGGGGGSSYTNPDYCQDETHTQGYSNGNGNISISYLLNCTIRMPVTVTVIHPPFLSSFSPTSAGPGTQVTLSGTHFTGVQYVSFGTTDAASFTIVNDNQIIAVVGNGSSGSVRVVAGIDSSSQPGFTYIPPPSITSFSPTTATTGTIITINGFGFTDALLVKIGGVDAASFTIVSPSQITALVGAGNSGDVSVLKPTVTLNRSGFMYIPPPAPPGNCLSFDGVDDFVRINDPFESFTNQITVEWWAKFDPSSQANSGMGQASADVNDAGLTSWLMSYNNGNLRFYVNDNGTYRYAESAVPPGWHHWAGFADATSTRLYMDGNLVGTIGAGISSGIINNPNSVIDIGKQVLYPSGSFMNGKVDEVRIWFVARTQAQIRAAMNNILTIPQFGLVEYYNFDSGVPDYPNANVLNLVNQVSTYGHGILNNFALAGGDVSNWSESYAMVVPNILGATNISSTSFTANWSAPGTGIADHYLLDVSTNLSFTSYFSFYEGYPVFGLSQKINGLNDSTVYYYRVRAHKNMVQELGIYSAVMSAVASNPCPAGNTQFSSNLTGSSYQWQVNDGTGFINISNSGFYSGANSKFLQLSGTPDTWYGYKYRCIVDGTNSEVLELKYSVYWRGSTNADWSNPANWSCGTVPTVNTDVFIRSGSPNPPNVPAGIYRCASLTTDVSVNVFPGARLEIGR